MSDRRPAQGDHRDDEERRRRHEFTGEGGYASDEEDQTRTRERIARQGVDEAGEIPAADADVEAGESRRSERYED